MCQLKQTLEAELERYFRPEFLNRLDDKIVFRALTREDLVLIVEYELAKVQERLQSREMTLVVETSSKDFLIEKGYNPNFGARPLRRAIEQYVEDQLAEHILRGDFKSGQSIRVWHEKDETHLRFEAQDSEPAPPDKEDLAATGAEST